MVSNVNGFSLPTSFGAATTGPKSLASSPTSQLAGLGGSNNALNPLAGYQGALGNLQGFMAQLMVQAELRKLQNLLNGGAPALNGGAPAPASPTNALANAVGNAGNAGNAGAIGGAAPAAAGGRPRIAQIDDFSTDNTGFNHGQEVAKTLNPDGSAELLQLDVSGGGDRLDSISNSLDNLIQRVQNGEKIDAVNMSLQDFGDSPKAQEIRNKIDQLSAMNVPVAVAAGNGGAGQRNSLASNSAFTVASTSGGSVNGDSGVGNVQAEGRTTSFATANFVRQLVQQNAVGSNFSALA